MWFIFRVQRLSVFHDDVCEWNSTKLMTTVVFFKKRARLSTPEAHAPGRRANEAARRGTQEKKRAYSLVPLPRFMTTCSPEYRILTWWTLWSLHTRFSWSSLWSLRSYGPRRAFFAFRTWISLVPWRKRAICMWRYDLTISLFKDFWQRSVARSQRGREIALTYRKIPKRSPGAYIFQRLFLRGLFLEGLIFGGAYLRREICVSKSIGIAL